MEHSESYSTVAESTPIKFYINYAASSVIPKKSNGEDSSVTIPGGSLVITGSFNASVDKNVNKYTPVLSISNVSIGGIIYNNNNVVSGYYIGDTVDGSVKVVYKDGRFSPKSGYSNSFFDSNNPGSYIDNGTHYHNADCNISSLSTCINSASSTQITNPQVGTAYYDFTGTFVATQDNPNGELTIKIMGGHTVSNYTPKKLSNRPSDVSIAANNAMSSDLFTLKADTLQQQYHFVMVTTDDTSLGNPTLYTNVTQLFSNANYIIHCNETSTNLPDPYESPVVTGLPGEINGEGRHIIIVAAPSDYTGVIAYSNGIPMNTGSKPIIFTPDSGTIPYSSNDNTTYKLFRAKGNASGIQVCTINIAKS